MGTSLDLMTVNGGVQEGISMQLEGSQNRDGRETEWCWKRDRIAVEGSWAVGLTGDEIACAISTITIPGIRGRAAGWGNVKKMYTECKVINEIAQQGRTTSIPPGGSMVIGRQNGEAALSALTSVISKGKTFNQKPSPLSTHYGPMTQFQRLIKGSWTICGLQRTGFLHGQFPVSSYRLHLITSRFGCQLIFAYTAFVFGFDALLCHSPHLSYYCMPLLSHAAPSKLIACCSLAAPPVLHSLQQDLRWIQGCSSCRFRAVSHFSLHIHWSYRNCTLPLIFPR
eukprot:scaffold248404_cov65-Cyclotella_meneghiniana.AAC.2